ncbi:MAG: MarR family transcriptional regulator [Actinomycetota bacterium]|nr:MarR family transcriptional regulator [Actinomycetota bacterium]
MAEVELHVGQEMVLIELWREDGLRGGELAERLGVVSPTVTKMLRRLERCGLVSRRRDP